MYSSNLNELIIRGNDDQKVKILVASQVLEVSQDGATLNGEILGVGWAAVEDGISTPIEKRVGIGTEEFQYNFNGSDYTSKMLIKGETSGAGNTTDKSITIIDSNDRIVTQFDNAGRLDLFDYTNNGAVSVLYNISSDSGNVTAGHYAFGAKNSSGTLHTVADLLALTTVKTDNQMSSRIYLSFMDSVNTTGGYSQPNKSITIDSATGMTLPSIPLSGISNLQVGGTSVLIGKVAINTFSPNQYCNLTVDGVVGLTQTANGNSSGIYIYPAEFNAGTSIQGTASDIGTPKALLINGQGGNVGVGIQTTPFSKLHVNGAITLNSTSEPANPPAGSVVEWWDGTNKKWKKTDGTTGIIF